MPSRDKIRQKTAVVLVSGGMDSCVTAALAQQEYGLAFLHLKYGQKTERRELQAFFDIAAHYGVVRQLVVSMDHLAKVGGSSLTDPSLPIPDADLHAPGVPTTYVPFRNANMLSAAVSWAEVIGASAIFIGAVEEDSSGYPDCRKAFFEAFNVVIDRGTRPSTRIAIHTPVIGMSKKEIVRTGIALGAPLHLTWSCYRREDIACGVCDSCALRLRAFRNAGVDDAIEYDSRPIYPNS